MLFGLLLERIVREGTVRVIDARGRERTFGDGAAPRCTIRLHDRTLGMRLAIRPSLAVGEAFMEGNLTVEEGDLYDFLAILARNLDDLEVNPVFSRIGRIAHRLARGIPRDRARANVAHHYDLSSDLYRLYLDSDRQYSCAYFRSADDSLEDAQCAKKRHLAAKLYLNEAGLRVLDIGSGWGGLGLYLAADAGAEVTGITLSEEQHRISNERAAEAGLGERVRFHLRDYREETGAYDRIVSVGMFEHVGRRNYADYFGKIRELLTDDGVALVHSIGYSDEPGPINPFIRKYIFPGAELPALSEVTAAVERAGLIVTDVEVLRLHYADTLKAWRENFLANWERAAGLYDERFCRMWLFYLVLCEIGFRYRTMVVFQLQLTKRIDALPITRDYIRDWEQARETEGAGEESNSHLQAVGAPGDSRR